MTVTCTWCKKEMPERGRKKKGIRESICLECLEEALMLAGEMARKDAFAEKSRKTTRVFSAAFHA